jgi:hypothetical protein
MNTNFFVVVIDLPAQDDAGKVINDPATGKPIYQLNYFCRLDKETIPGQVLNEWDTDKNFAYRFNDATTAENFRRVVLDSLDGSRVEELRPAAINGKILSFKN